MNLTYLEYGANAFYLLAVFLAARNHIANWLFGVLGCVLFAILFYQVKLYAEVLLMLFFIVTNVIGWFQWRQSPHASAVGSAPPKVLLRFAALALLVTLCYGWVLHRFTDAYAPFIDTAVLMFSIVAQFLLMQRKLQTWWFWLMVNTLAVPLYFSRELYLTAIVYSGFWCNAWYGLYLWRKLAVASSETPTAAN